METQSPIPKRGRTPQFSARLLWPNGWMDHDATWYEGRPQPRRLCVRWGPSLPPHKGGGAASPIFGPFLLWPNGRMHQDATWYGGRPQTRGLWVRWGPSPLLPKGRRRPGAESPQFSAHGYCGRTAGWIKMALGMEVGLGPVHIVLDGDTAPLPKTGQSPQIFGPSLLWPNGGMHQDATWYGGRPHEAYATLCSMWTQLPPEKGHTHPTQFLARLLWPNGWMDEETAWYGSGPRPRPHCTRWGPTSHGRGTAAPSFRPMSTVATAAHLSYC